MKAILKKLSAAARVAREGAISAEPIQRQLSDRPLSIDQIAQPWHMLFEQL